MSEEQRRLLEKQLWAVANILRGKMNADEYRNYILGFIFYKYLSEKLEKFINEKLLVREDFVFSEIEEDTKKGKTVLEEIKKATVSHLGFFLKPTDLFGYLVKKGNGEIKGENTFILENLKNVLNTIEQTSMGTASEDDFKGLFDDVVLTSPKLGKSEQKKNEVIVEVLTKLSEIDFKLEDSKSDLLGDAYEYLIGEFAAGAGKKGGEFYTPAQVSRLLAQIVTEGKKRLKSVYDPTCGSGSLLLRIGDYANVSMYYGQELNPTTYNLARMNMILHGVPFDSFSIRQGDTLVDDMHLDLQAEAVVANPPFSAKWKGDSNPLLVADERFTQYGRLAPKGAADYAFVTHMLHHLADNGVMAVVLPHGALYRGGAEKLIRKYIVNKLNYLDAVIGLPENIFYGTDIETCILVFKKCRNDDDNILFIDASEDFERGNKQNILRDKDIERIFNTYCKRKNISRYSQKISTNEIVDNNYYLNIPRYVKKIELPKPINFSSLTEEYKIIEAKIIDIDTKLIKYQNESAAFLPVLNVSEDINHGSFWRKAKLSELLTESKKRNRDLQCKEVFSVAKDKGVINQIEHLGRSYASDDISNYKVVEPYDVIYTKSPTASFPYGIIKQNKTNRSGVVSVLYAVYKPISPDFGLYLDYYFSSWENTLNYLRPIVNKGAKNTINLNNDEFLNASAIWVPSSDENLKFITSYLKLINEKYRLLEKLEKNVLKHRNGLVNLWVNKD